MKFRMIIMLLVVAAVFGLVFGWVALRNHFIAQFMATRGLPPQSVSTTVAVTDDWQPRLEGVGSLRAVNGADLSAQVAGTVSAIHFESGTDVKAGTLLVELASADDVAKLQSLRATAALGQITLDRDQKQFKVQGVSQQTIDSDAQNLKNALALVAQQQATVDYKMIRAPFDGRLGIRQVDLGQYLAAGTTMVTLQSLDPIYIDFYLPQQSLSEVKVGQKVDAKVDTFAGRLFPGEITSINSKVDTDTRNIQIRATLPNPDKVLLPGMYGTVEIAAGERRRLVTLPQTAIVYNSFGSNVFIVDDQGKDEQGKPKMTVRSVFVATGATRGDQVSVLSGVKEGDTVVVAGQVKLRNGMSVVVDNGMLPTNDPHPLPVDQ